MTSEIKVCIITIHKGPNVDLLKTFNSVKRYLNLDILEGYFIYESSNQSLSVDETLHPKIKYIYNQRSEGINISLNSSQAIASELFPESTHYCYIHSNDEMSLDHDCYNILKQGLKLNPLPDIITWGFSFQSKRETSSFIPDFLGLSKGMTISHIGTFISHKIHNNLKGYSLRYRYAMDYHFFIRAIYKCNYRSFNSRICKIDGEGLSSKYPFFTCKDVYFSQLECLSKNNKDRVFYTFLFLYSIFKRSIYLLLNYFPGFRKWIRLRINPLIIK